MLQWIARTVKNKKKSDLTRFPSELMFPLLFSSRKGEEKAEAKKMWNEQRFFVEMLESMRILSYDQCSSIDDASYFSARRGRRDSRRG